jgi:hypothetical protein
VIQRVFTEIIGKPFLRGLLFPYFLFLLAVSAADSSTNWEAQRLQISTLPPAVRTSLFVGLICSWCLVAGRALRPIWRDKTIPFLVRQPMGPWELSARLLPSLSVALIPVVSMWWLASYGTNPVTHYPGFVGLALPIILGASFSGITSVVVVGVGIAALALVIWAYSYTNNAAYLGMLVTPVLFRGAASCIRSTLAVQSSAVHRQMRSPSLIWVLVRRDWRSILRSRRQTFAELIVGNALIISLMLGFRINGRDSGRDALIIACVLFLIGALPAYRNLEVAKAQLGTQIMCLAWPVTYFERAVALIVLAALLAAPSAIPIALLGSAMGLLNWVVFMVFVLATVIFAATLFAKTLLRDSSSVGLYLNLILFHGVLMSVLAPWEYLLLAVLGIGVSFRWMTSGLKCFANQASGGDSA